MGELRYGWALQLACRESKAKAHCCLIIGWCCAHGCIPGRETLESSCGSSGHPATACQCMSVRPSLLFAQLIPRDVASLPHSCLASQHFKTAWMTSSHKEVAKIRWLHSLLHSSVEFLLGNKSSSSDTCPCSNPPAYQFASQPLKCSLQANGKERWPLRSFSFAQGQKIARFMLHSVARPSVQLWWGTLVRASESPWSAATCSPWGQCVTPLGN